MKELSEKASVAEVGQHLSTAQEIIGSDEGAQVVAFLLKSYFNRASESASSSPRRSSTNTERRAQSEPSGESGEGRRGGRRRRRRSRRGRRNRDEPSNEFAEAQGESSAPDSAFAVDPDAVANVEETVSSDGLKRLRVNIGFDDGFKGRGAVAKKISALAGLNDGIVKEVESKRDHAVLKASPEIAELVIERVDGAQLGKKTITVHEFN